MGQIFKKSVSRKIAKYFFGIGAILLLGFLVFSGGKSVVEATPSHPKPAYFGLEVYGDAIESQQGELAALGSNLKLIRLSTGDELDPVDTLYKHYLNGGWAAVDAEIGDQLDVVENLNAIPLVRFMYGTPTCVAPTPSQIAAYATFVADFAEMYELEYVEVWNEPDSSNQVALPSIYGCFGGPGNITLLNSLLDQVQNQVPSSIKVGVSFAMAGANQLPMIESAISHADWMGIHHYDSYAEDAQGGIILNSWPGSNPGPNGLGLKLDMAKQIAGNKPVWLTEVNLYSPDDFCTESHQWFAYAYIKDLVYPLMVQKNIPQWSILVYASYPEWQCTGIRNSLIHDYLLGIPPCPNPNNQCR